MYYSRVFNRQTGELLGHLIDITPGGAMIISDVPIPLNQLFRLRMDVPEKIIEKAALDFEARSVWCDRDVNPDFFDTGFQMVNITPEDSAVIEQMIDDYGFRE